MKTDSLLVNLPKNVVQYLIGFSLYLLVFGSFNPVKLVLGLTSFIITYSAIYPYNDLMDYDKDKKDAFKKVYKALVRGDLSRNNAITLVFILPIIGLVIASMVNQWYPLILSFLLFQNFLHSSPKTTHLFKKKKKYMIPNMFIMQSIKFTLGWLTFTTELTLLPYWIITMLSSAYLWAYIIYKNNLKNMKDSFKKNMKVMIPLSIIIISSYVISIIIYPYKIALITFFPLVFLFLSMKNQKNVVKKTFKLSNMTVIVLAIIVGLLLLLNVPIIAQINDNTTQAFHKVGEQLNLEENQAVLLINDTLYSFAIKDLNEFFDFFNISGKEITVRQ